MLPDTKPEKQSLPTISDPKIFLENFYSSDYFTGAHSDWVAQGGKGNFFESKKLKKGLVKFNEKEQSFELNPQNFPIDARIQLRVCRFLLDEYGNAIRYHHLMDIHKNIVVDEILKELKLDIPESKDNQLTKGLTRALVDLILEQNEK